MSIRLLTVFAAGGQSFDVHVDNFEMTGPEAWTITRELYGDELKAEGWTAAVIKDLGHCKQWGGRHWRFTRA